MRRVTVEVAPWWIARLGGKSGPKVFTEGEKVPLEFNGRTLAGNVVGVKADGVAVVAVDWRP